VEAGLPPMTADSVRELLAAAGAQVMARSGRTEHYSAPREFSFEVKGTFPNGMTLHIVARQFNYRDPWEASGRVNDLVDVMLLKEGESDTVAQRVVPTFRGLTKSVVLTRNS